MADVQAGYSDAGDIVLTIGSASSEVILTGMDSNSSAGVQQVTFADGTVWSASDLLNRLGNGEMLNDTSAADKLYGSDGADTIDGGGGDDYVEGHGGGDTFVFKAGYGHLEISEEGSSGSTNILQLGAGLTPSSVTVSAGENGAAVLSFGSSGDQITLDGMLGDTSAGVQRIEFSDGTVWSDADVRAMAPPVPITGTTGDDSLYGTGANEIFDGLGGNDYEVGQGGDDTFIFNAGYGHLEISQWNPLPNFESTLQFGTGITPGDITKSLSENGNIILSIGTSGDQVTLDYQNYQDGDGVSAVRFADGTVWSLQDLYISSIATSTDDDLVFGTTGADTIDGLGASSYDYVQGEGGGDTFIYKSGYGELDISEYDTSSGADNILQFGAGITPEEVSIVQTSWDAIQLNIGSSGDVIYLYNMQSDSAAGVQHITFADGTVWSGDDLRDSAILGFIGNDSLTGTIGADAFDGAGGTDVEHGLGGGDTFVFNAGYGQLEIGEVDTASSSNNILKLGAGITTSDVTVISDGGGNIVLVIGSDGDQVTLDGMASSVADGVQTILFSDGTSWDRATVLGLAVPPGITGTTGNDSLTGTSGADHFDGRGGNDIETGLGGDDTFVFNAGYGHLEINEQDSNTSANNVLILGAGITTSGVTVTTDGNGNLLLADGTTGDQVKLDGEIFLAASGVQGVRFADGTVWTRQQMLDKGIIGTTGANTLTGTSGADIIDGKGGNDVVTGNGGNDAIFFNAGYGHLEINEQDSNSAANNVLILGAGITTGGVTVSSDGSGNLLLADSTTGDQVKLDGEIFSATSGVQGVRFADGTVWTRQQMLDKGIIGTTGANTLTGTSGADIIDGKGGNDVVTGNGGNDAIFFNAGYGVLEVSEYDTNSSANNVLLMGTGLNPADFTVRDDGYGNFILTDSVTGDIVELNSEIYTPQWGVQTIRFSNGTSWSRTDLINKGLVGTTGNDNLVGTSGNEIVDGKGGNDFVTGNGGNDTYLFNAGYGTLEIYQDDQVPTPSNTLAFGPGISPTDIQVWDDGYGDAMLYNSVTGDTVALDAEINSSKFGVQKVVFSDSGTIWTRQTILDKGIVGTTGNNTLTGTTAAEFFQGKGGVDTINGGGGNDVYIFNPGDGQVTINNVGGSVAHGSLEFSSAVDDEDLWFTHTSNNLVIQRIGSTDKVMISNWFASNASAKLSEITLDGLTEIDSQLNSLISAMATYKTNHSSFNPATATAMPTDTTLQSAIAASWHG